MENYMETGVDKVFQVLMDHIPYMLSIKPP